MILKTLLVGPIQTNCYIIGCDKTKEAIIVDPGGDFELIDKEIRRNKLKPGIIVNTHSHIDHVGAVSRLKDCYRISFGLSKNDLPVLDSVPQAAEMFGLDDVDVPKVDFYLKEGDKIKAGEIELKVIETPGHTKGSVCFVGEGFMFSGDTLFQGSIGRTDLPGGSCREIMKSINEKILALDDSWIIYPGHGDKTSVGNEKRYNPFVQQDSERI